MQKKYLLNVVIAVKIFLLVGFTQKAFTQNFDPNTWYRLTTNWQGEGKSMEALTPGEKYTAVQLKPTSNSPYQAWKIISLSNGYFRLINKAYGDGKSIDLIEDGSYFVPQIASSGNFTGQFWKFTALSGGYFRMTSSWKGEGQSLDVRNDGRNNILQLTNSGAYIGQMWMIKAITGDSPHPSSDGPSGYTKCASEGGSYTFNNTVDVAYGANGKFVYKQGLTGTIAFNNSTFGDPVPGVAKSGYYKNAAAPAPEPSQAGPQGYTKCASEGGSYTFNNKVDVAYGANGKFVFKQGLNGTVTFNNGTFGDPVPGVAKSGYYRNAQTPTPSPTPTPTPTPSGGEKIIYVSDISESDVKAVMGWIKNKLTSEKLPYCWKKSYTRDAGIVANTCPPNTERDPNGALCYPRCPPDYLAVGPVCWKNCPPGYTNMGPTCLRNVDDYSAPSTVADCPSGYTNVGATCFRGVHDYSAPSTVADCPSGYTNMGATCYRWQSLSTLGMSSMTCPAGRFRTGARCYVNCPAGYTNTGEFCHRDASSLSMSSMTCPPGRFRTGARCYINCRDGYTNTGEFCHRDAHVISNSSEGRGLGSVLVCPPDRIRDETGGPLGLCYEKCKPGYHGSAFACYQDCPPGWTACGAGCAKTVMECATNTIDMVTSTMILAANIATLGMASSVNAPLNAGTQTIKVGNKMVTGTTKTGKLAVKALGAMQTIGKAGEVAEKITVAKKVFKVVMGAKEVISNTYTVVSSSASIIEEFESAFAEDFIAQTSREINDEIDRKFSPFYAEDIKRKWGEIQLFEMASASGFAIAQDVLAIASIADPTGVVGVISAFMKPVCQDNITFPNLSRTYK